MNELCHYYIGDKTNNYLACENEGFKADGMYQICLYLGDMSKCPYWNDQPNEYTTREIIPFVKCPLNEGYITLCLCRQCRSNVGVDNENIECKIIGYPVNG